MAKLKENETKVFENLENSVLSKMHPDARARLSNIRLANPLKYAAVIQQLAYLFNSNYLHSPLSDSQLLEILKQLNNKKTINIRRR